MRPFFFIVLGMSLVSSFSFAESSGQYNRRNRGRSSLKVVEHSKKSRPIQKSKRKEQSIVHMPAVFDSSVADSKQFVEKPVIVEALPKEKEEKIIQKVKKPSVIKNDPEKSGADPQRFYEKLSGESRRVFEEMDPQGKILALRLSIPYQDPDQAVEDASFEMQRRQQTASVRKQRSQRKRSVYY